MLQVSRVVCELHIIGRDLDSWLKEVVPGLPWWYINSIVGRDLDSWLKGKEYQDFIVLN